MADETVLRVVVQDDSSQTVNGTGDFSGSRDQSLPVPRDTVGPADGSRMFMSTTIYPVWVVNWPKGLGVVSAAVTADRDKDKNQPYPLARRRKPRAAQARVRARKRIGVFAQRASTATALAVAAIESFTLAVRASTAAIAYEASLYESLVHHRGTLHQKQIAAEYHANVADNVASGSRIAAGAFGLAGTAATVATVSGVSGAEPVAVGALVVAAAATIVAGVAKLVGAAFSNEAAELRSEIQKRQLNLDLGTQLGRYNPGIASAQAQYHVGNMQRDFRQAQYLAPTLTPLLRLQNTEASLDRALESIRLREKMDKMIKTVEEHIAEQQKMLHDEAAREAQRIKDEAWEKMKHAHTQEEGLKIQKDMLDQLKRLHDLEQEKNSRGTIDEVLKGLKLPDLSPQVAAEDRQRDHWRNDHLDIPVLLTGR